MKKPPKKSRYRVLVTRKAEEGRQSASVVVSILSTGPVTAQGDALEWSFNNLHWNRATAAPSERDPLVLIPTFPPLETDTTEREL